MNLTINQTEPETEKPLDYPVKGKYQIQMLVIGDGVNHHGTLRLNELNWKQKYEETFYNIASKNLFLITRNPIIRIRDKIRGIKHRFLIVFTKGNPDAVNLSVSEDIPSEILYIASKSGALKGALSELFSTHIGFKKIAFVLILVGVGIIVYLVQTGKLALLMR